MIRGLVSTFGFGSGPGIRTLNFRLTDRCTPLGNGGTNSPSAAECRQLARFAAGVAVRPEPSLDSHPNNPASAGDARLDPAAGFDQLSALVAVRLATPLAAPWFEL